jgi:hypothetical protein
MRILLLHPEDSPLDGPWTKFHWDLIADLGWAGRSQYQLWQKQLSCPVHGLFDYAEWREDVRHIQQAFEIGNDSLLDAEGIDWWMLLTPRNYLRFYEFLLLEKVAREIVPSSELFVTRAHSLADTLSKLSGTKVTALGAELKPAQSSRFRRYTEAIRTLTPGQIAMIAGDKWDVDYRFRRLLARKRKSYSRARVLLPSAYRNVSRTAVAYASLLPECSFVLVTTRADGFLPDLPRQVEAVTLAAYAPVPRNAATEQEIASLTAQWKLLENKLLQTKDPAFIHVAGLFANMPRSLRNGLRIRDAWRAVLEQESITAVLCGDESNPYTRLPVLLARKRGVRTVHCSHGALDANILLRGACSDTYLVKGEMEKDYLIGHCGVPEVRVVIGGPEVSHFSDCTDQSRAERSDIFFFSEPYELYSGRTETFYQKLLPNLCEVARRHGRKVVLKLHPFESLRARTKLLDRILNETDRKLVEISTAPMSEQPLGRIWFALTVESSVAVECALAGVPCFLCGWFDLDLYDYGKQYQKFGAAQILESPEQVLRIPESLVTRPTGFGGASRLYQPITPERLAEVLQGQARVGREGSGMAIRPV